MHFLLDCVKVICLFQAFQSYISLKYTKCMPGAVCFWIFKYEQLVSKDWWTSRKKLHLYFMFLLDSKHAKLTFMPILFFANRKWYMVHMVNVSPTRRFNHCVMNPTLQPKIFVFRQRTERRVQTELQRKHPPSTVKFFYGSVSQTLWPFLLIARGRISVFLSSPCKLEARCVLKTLLWSLHRTRDARAVTNLTWQTNESRVTACDSQVWPWNHLVTRNRQ